MCDGIYVLFMWTTTRIEGEIRILRSHANNSYKGGYLVKILKKENERKGGRRERDRAREKIYVYRLRAEEKKDRTSFTYKSFGFNIGDRYYRISMHSLI